MDDIGYIKGVWLHAVMIKLGTYEKDDYCLVESEHNNLSQMWFTLDDLG